MHYQRYLRSQGLFSSQYHLYLRTNLKRAIADKSEFRVNNAFIRESFALFRESYALFRESYAFIRENYALISEK